MFQKGIFYLSTIGNGPNGPNNMNVMAEHNINMNRLPV